MNPVAIANLALGWLGQATRITTFEDATKPAQIIKEQFAGLRDACLEDADWTFATGRLVIPKDPNAPLFDYDARYQLPGQVLRVITCSPGGAGGTLDAFAASMLPPDDGQGLEWAKEGCFIVTVGTPTSIKVKAIVRAEDPNEWSPGFCQALAARIASDLAVPLTANRSLQDDMWKLYKLKRDAAATNDGRQGRSQRLRSTYLAARRR